MKIKEFTEDIVIHLSFGMLLVASALFFEERIVADAAFYLSKVINEEAFHIEHQRYILALSQLFTLLSVKLHLPLKTVLIVHSIGHVLFFYALFLICRYVLQNRIAGWWILLCQTAGLLHGFFVPMFELYYAAGLLVLVYSLKDSGKPFAIIISIACLFLIMTSHLFGILLALWLLVMLYLERKLSVRWILSFAGILVYIAIAKMFFLSEYESGKMSASLDAWHRNDHGLPYIGQAFSFLLKFYLDIVVLGIAVVLFTAFTNRIKLAVFLLFFLIVFAGIHFQYYGFERSRYQEQVYFPLTVIISGSFLIFMVNKDSLLKNIALPLVFIIFCVRFFLIWNEADIFTKRVEYFKKCINECQEINASKCALEDAAYPADVLDPNWSFPIETMFLSSYSGAENAVTVCMLSDLKNESVVHLLDEEHFLFRRLEVMKDGHLNPRYFKLKPENYRVILPE